MKLVVWMNIRSHHQSDFFSAILDENPDFRVVYYGVVPAARVGMGWSRTSDLKKFEISVSPNISELEKVEEWRECVHIIPGYGNRFLRSLVRYLSYNNVQWVHWSERSRPGLRWLASFPLKRWYAYMVERYALGALAIGASAAKDFARWGISTERIAFLPYSISGLRPLPSDSDIVNFKGNRRAFLYVGSLYRGKGVDLLLKAFKDTSQCCPDWCLIFVGDDRAQGEYRKYVKKFAIEDRIFFRKVIVASEISSAYRAADVLVLPSRYDGWGMVVNEAAAMGLALIVSDAAGSAWHMVDQGVNGFRVRSGDVDALRHAMSAYIRSPDLARIHGEASKHIFENYSSKVMAKRLLGILHKWQEACQ